MSEHGSEVEEAKRSDGFQLACAALLAVVGLPAFSGPIRAALLISPSAALGLSAVAIASVIGLWAARARPRLAHDQGTWLALALAASCIAGTLAVLYNPRFDGLVTVGGGDAGMHAALALSFSQSEPREYYGFVSTYALWHWLGTAFGMDAFERVRLGFYLTASAIPLAIASAVRLALPAGRWPPATAVWIACALGGASFFCFWPLLHYHQADGFYGHLFALVPLLASWLAYAQLESPLARVSVLAAAVGVMRFTYGLNLGDLALAGCGLTAWEAFNAGELKSRWWRIAVLALSFAFAGGAMAAYARLLPLSTMEGGFVPTRLEWILPGLAVPVAGLVFAVRPSGGLPRTVRRLAAFAGAFGAVSLAAQLAYLGSGMQPRYYFYKYGLHAVVLALSASIPVAAAVLARRPRLVAFGACSLVFVVGLVMLSRGSPYRRSFTERLRRSPPWTWIGPLTDRDADARIDSVLSMRRSAFGGLLTASWPMASFMNGSRGRLLDVPAFQRADVDDSPGHCVFWFKQESSPITGFDPGGSSVARAEAISRLAGDPEARCDSYAPRWDSGGAQVFCWLCR